MEENRVENSKWWWTIPAPWRETQSGTDWIGCFSTMDRDTEQEHWFTIHSLWGGFCVTDYSSGSQTFLFHPPLEATGKRKNVPHPCISWFNIYQPLPVLGKLLIKKRQVEFYWNNLQDTNEEKLLFISIFPTVPRHCHVKLTLLGQHCTTLAETHIIV